MLYSSSLLLIFLGVYLIINTFNRFEKRPNFITTLATNNPTLAKGLGYTLILCSEALLYINHSFWPSFFMWLNGFMLLLMLIVLINPIAKFKPSHAYIIFGIILILELLLTYAS